MSQDLYHEMLLEEARHPHNQGELADAAVVVQETNASCGDSVQLYVNFSSDGQRIAEIAWQGSGCVISQAATSVLSEYVKGTSRTAVLQLTQADLERLLGLSGINPGRSKCLLLGLSALKKGIQEL